MNFTRILLLPVAFACAALSACADLPDQSSPGGVTRAQVKAELADAIRLGDIRVGDANETLAEMYPQRYAAVRAQAQAERDASAAATASR